MGGVGNNLPSYQQQLVTAGVPDVIQGTLETINLHLVEIVRESERRNGRPSSVQTVQPAVPNNKENNKSSTRNASTARDKRNLCSGRHEDQQQPHPDHPHTTHHPGSETCKQHRRSHQHQPGSQNNIQRTISNNPRQHSKQGEQRATHSRTKKTIWEF